MRTHITNPMIDMHLLFHYAYSKNRTSQCIGNNRRQMMTISACCKDSLILGQIVKFYSSGLFHLSTLDLTYTEYVISRTFIYCLYFIYKYSIIYVVKLSILHINSIEIFEESCWYLPSTCRYLYIGNKWL